MGHAGGGRLPSGYRRVEYLESTGTQYIDTQVMMNQPLKIVTTCYSSGQGNSYMGAVGDGTGGGSDAHFSLYLSRDNGSNSGASCRKYSNSTGNLNVSIPFISLANYCMDNIKGVFSLNDYNTTFTPQDLSGAGNYPIFIFGRSLFGAPQLYSMRVFCLKLFDVNGLVRNFVPALDPTGRPCMYDLVEQKPYYNEATEGPDFLWGGDSEVELPVGYRRCTYLESDGASYIDTGMTQVDDYVFTAKTKPVLNMRLFGSGTQAPAFYTYMSGNFTTGTPQQAYNNSVLTAPNAFDPNKVQTVVISREGVSIDDKQFAFSKEPAGQFTAPESIKLFGYVGSSGAMTITAGTTIYYYSVIRRNGSKEMELVPCLSPDNTPCMVDTVTGRVYTNQGDGTFLWG